MTDHNAITPPPELLQQLLELCGTYVEPSWHWKTVDKAKALLVEACQYGADQELEACCEWVQGLSWDFTPNDLRAARRPKPLSLKEQALKELAWVGKHLDMPLHNRCNAIHTIHQALKKLDD